MKLRELSEKCFEDIVWLGKNLQPVKKLFETHLKCARNLVSILSQLFTIPFL